MRLDQVHLRVVREWRSLLRFESLGLFSYNILRVPFFNSGSILVERNQVIGH
jgi:hypothetical protein